MIKLVLLPGMDGTGIMFEPLRALLPDDYAIQLMSYPAQKKLSYQELTAYVERKLPKNESFVLLAESFSGPIAYEIAKNFRNFEVPGSHFVLQVNPKQCVGIILDVMNEIKE